MVVLITRLSGHDTKRAANCRFAVEIRESTGELGKLLTNPTQSPNATSTAHTALGQSGWSDERAITRKLMDNQSFHPAWWLPGPHLQTLWSPLFRKQPKLPRQRERIELDDGDFIDLDWCNPKQVTQGPLTLILHGLTGSSDSNYAWGLQYHLMQKGQPSVVMHFRGASDAPNRHARMYHSGDTADVRKIAQLLLDRGWKQLFAAGYSLGGNVLLKWLGETGRRNPITAAVAVSVPFELKLCAETMDHGFSRVYRNEMLGSLKNAIAQKRRWAQQHDAQVFETLNALGDVNRHQTFREYDQHVVSPLNGFKSADDYYQRCSSRAFVPNIHIPTLIIHSVDDPLMVPQVIPKPDELPAGVTLELYAQGGHVGFVAGRIPFRPEYWLEQRVAAFFAEKSTEG